jgi:amino acid transporter
MSRDGLLPPAFQKVHHKYKTPSFATVITGLLVGVPLLFTDRKFVLDFTSIGTLFAFVLVCGGVLLIPKQKSLPGRFTMPDISGKYFFPLIVIVAIILATSLSKNYFTDLLNIDFANDDATFKLSTIIFWIVCVVLAILAFLKNLSLIPLMGLSTCLYLLTGMSASNWKWFFAWFGIGLVVYLFYGLRKSKLAVQK